MYAIPGKVDLSLRGMLEHASCSTGINLLILSSFVLRCGNPTESVTQERYNAVTHCKAYSHKKDPHIGINYFHFFEKGRNIINR